VNERPALERRLSELRIAFDGAFALPAEAPLEQRHAYLGIRSGDVPYALDLDEVEGIRRHVAVTFVPSDEPLLLGVAGFSGVLTAVYDLGAALGHAKRESPSWFVLVRGAPIAFAFHALEGQLRGEADAGVQETTATRDAALELVFRAGLSRPVIRLGALVARLRANGLGDLTEGTAPR
jgi:hypothetical protein